MPTYTCSNCSFTTDKKYNYTRHCKSPKHKQAIVALSQKNSIVDNSVTVKKTIVENTTKYTCSFCDITFAHITSLYRHQKHNCKKNPKLLSGKCDEKDKKIKNLEAKVIELNEEKCKLMSSNEEIMSELKVIKSLVCTFMIEQKKCNEELDDKIDKIDTLYEMCKTLLFNRNR